MKGHPKFKAEGIQGWKASVLVQRLEIALEEK